VGHPSLDIFGIQIRREKKVEDRGIYLENKIWRRKRRPIEMNEWYLC
jgi:hypothetical protein